MKYLIFIIFVVALLQINAQNNTVKVKIENIGKQVNSAFSDFAPVISADGLTMFFTSRRPTTPKEIEKNKEVMESVYQTEYDIQKRKWTKTIRINNIINIQDRNNSAIALSNDGQRMLLYRDDIFGNGDIYESTLAGTEWSDAKKLPVPINSEYHESSASYSPDGRTIYFVSSRKDGAGKRDIWYCTQNIDGVWGNAKNIGAPINTKEDEEGVFMHPDGKTLYFSSKVQGGAGGFDIYKSVYENEKWGTPENISKLNTPGDDVYFVMEANGTVGYYASAKPGGTGEKDIYKVTFSYTNPKEKKQVSKLILLKGIISDELTGKIVLCGVYHRKQGQVFLWS